MSPERDSRAEDLRMNTENLYREETFTDLEVGSLRRLTPVTADGAPDPMRPTRYIGQTQLMTRAGPLPIEMPIEAASLKEAAGKFAAAVEEAMQRIAEQIERHQIEQSRRIVVPGTGGVGGPGGIPGVGGPNDLLIR